MRETDCLSLLFPEFPLDVLVGFARISVFPFLIHQTHAD